jgi:hypothetical protein
VVVAAAAAASDCTRLQAACSAVDPAAVARENKPYAYVMQMVVVVVEEEEEVAVAVAVVKAAAPDASQASTSHGSCRRSGWLHKSCETRRW